MDFHDSQGDSVGRGTVDLHRERLYVNCVARAMKLARVISDQFDGSPASYVRFTELLESFDRDVNTAVTAPIPSDGITGLGNPPLPPPKARKKTGHTDSFEGRP